MAAQTHDVAGELRVGDPSRHGVFYDFYGEPEVKSLSEAIALGNHSDAIFSLDPGRLAIHFSHEGWSWLCQR